MDHLLDSRQLRAFTVLAREGSFTQAGRVLHLTQSAISHAIKSLEAELGCQLFHRLGRRALPTPHGRELLRHAEMIQKQMGQARISLGALDKNPRGHLRIGCTPSASQFILPTVLREFKDSFPLYSITVVPGETPDILTALEAGGVDVAITLKPVDTTRLNVRPLFQDELMFLVSPLHPWATQPPKQADFAQQTFILLSRNSLTFQLVSDYFMKLNIKPKSIIELGNPGGITELVKVGVGVAIGAPWTNRAELASGELVAVPLLRSRIKRQWIATCLKDKPITLVEQTLIGLCEDVSISLGAA
ncbi:LysR family transcriptional regulator [Phragmitibacter flavus]|uniref:LysR family transcriptional regulator n=1 Tax=Phragmitibacter flavus TaxID=2576071 RepID=A0A5R8KD70_9BACT|nr:LysR family transcriptional regulator [Phragmitibacter flavus]TLD70187.1 LysR family transcriptional regulator [Phragmitibacter flavus]